MTIVTVLLLGAVLIGVGVWGIFAQQSFVMLMMGLELAINGVMISAAGLWRFTSAGQPKGQVLVIVALFVMAIEAAIGFGLVVAVYRARQVDMTEGLDRMKQ